MAVRRTTIKRGVGPALDKVIEPGDQIVAGTWAMAGPGPWLDMLGVLPFLVFGVVGITTGASPGVWGSVTTVLSLILVFRRWRQDLDEVLAALHTRGASVAGLPPSRAASLRRILSR